MLRWLTGDVRGKAQRDTTLPSAGLQAHTQPVRTTAARYRCWRGQILLIWVKKIPPSNTVPWYPQSQPCVLRKPAGQSGRLKRTIFPSTEVTVCTACKAENGSCFKHPVIKGENSSDTSCYMCRGLWLALQQN